MFIRWTLQIKIDKALVSKSNRGQDKIIILFLLLYNMKVYQMTFHVESFIQFKTYWMKRAKIYIIFAFKRFINIPNYRLHILHIYNITSVSFIMTPKTLWLQRCTHKYLERCIANIQASLEFWCHRRSWTLEGFNMNKSFYKSFLFSGQRKKKKNPHCHNRKDFHTRSALQQKCI